MRRSIRPLAAAVLALVLLGGCSTTAAAGSTAMSSSTTTASSSASASGTTLSATSLTSGSWTGTFDGQQVTLKAAYLVDGVDVTIDAGTYASATADQAVFLVVNGGHLTISGVTVTKSGDASSSDSTRTSDVSDAYNFYGLNSAIVSSVTARR